MSLKLLGINGSVTKNSRTGVVVHTVLDAAAEAYPEIETELSISVSTTLSLRRADPLITWAIPRS